MLFPAPQTDILDSDGNHISSCVEPVIKVKKTFYESHSCVHRKVKQLLFEIYEFVQMVVQAQHNHRRKASQTIKPDEKGFLTHGKKTMSAASNTLIQ